jgi:hypothetical protein
MERKTVPMIARGKNRANADGRMTSAKLPKCNELAMEPPSTYSPPKREGYRLGATP